MSKPNEQTRSRLHAVTAGTGFGSQSRILAELASLDSSKWTLALVESLASAELQNAIATLANLAVPPNPFFDVPFLSAAADRLGSKDKRFLVLTETIGDTEALKFFAPAQMEQCGFPRKKTLRIWSHLYAPISTPLVDPCEVDLVVERLAQALMSIETTDFPAILFEDLNLEAAFTKAVLNSSLLADQVEICCPHERAGLQPLQSGSYDQIHISGKRRQRLRRAMENLSGLGKVEFETAYKFSDAMVRFEEFLLLESRGWKGKRGTSLQRIRTTAAFARQAVANMVQENRCQISSLRLNGKAVATMIVFRAGGYYYPWKIAFDESYYQYSVGVQLITHVNNQLMQTPGFKGVDSLAVDTNVTANQFWPDRIKMGSLAIGLGANNHAAAKICAALERQVWLKKKAKHLLGR